MIWACIVSFVAGGLFTFGLLFLIAVCSLKSKQRQLNNINNQIKLSAEPIDFKNFPTIRRKKGSPRVSKLENYLNNNVKKDGVK